MGGIGRGNAGEVVSLSIKPQNGDVFTFGKLQPSRWTVKNLTDKAVLVTEVKPVVRHGTGVRDDRGNALGMAKQADNYVKYSDLRQAWAAGFYSALLLPGEEASIDDSCCRDVYYNLVQGYRAVSSAPRYRIEYVAATATYDGTADSLKPLDVYLLAREAEAGRTSDIYSPSAVYSRFTEDLWKHNRKLGYRRDTVYIPSIPEGKQSAEVVASVPITGSGFDLNEAIKVAARIDGRPEDQITLAYVSALGGYLVYADKALPWLLKSEKQTSKGRVLPDVPSCLFDEVERDKVVRLTVAKELPKDLNGHEPAAGKKLWNCYPILDSRDPYIEIRPEDLNRFLDDLKAHDERIKVRLAPMDILMPLELDPLPCAAS